MQRRRSAVPQTKERDSLVKLLAKPQQITVQPHYSDQDELHNAMASGFLLVTFPRAKTPTTLELHFDK